MISVCQIISSFRPDIGGAERATENLCAGLCSHLRVSVLTRYYAGRPRYEELNSVPVYRLGCGGRNWFGSITFILHCFFWLVFCGSDFRVIHVQNIDSPLLVGMLAKFLLRRKLVVTLQGEQTIIQRKRTWLGLLRVRLMSKLGDGFVAVTGETEKQFLREGISPQKIVRIPNCIDTDYFSPPSRLRKVFLRKHFGYGVKEKIVLYLGRLVSVKRVEVLLNAAKDFRSVGFMIVGDGPERERLEALVRSEGLEGVVRFYGSTYDVLPYYQVADIFVLPSLYEGLSVALIEAMSCGLCVVVSDSPGNREAVVHGVNGLLFPVEHPELLTSRLGKVLRSSRMRARFGYFARRAVRDSRSIPTVVSAHLEFYRSLFSS